MEFATEGESFLTAGWDGQARAWDATTGRPLGEPLRHADGVRQAVFSADSRRVATACPR